MANKHHDEKTGRFLSGNLVRGFKASAIPATIVLPQPLPSAPMPTPTIPPNAGRFPAASPTKK